MFLILVMHQAWSQMVLRMHMYHRPSIDCTHNYKSKSNKKRQWTNKHHSLRHRVNTDYCLFNTKIKLNNDLSFVFPSSIPINTTTIGLTDLQYKTAVQDPTNGDIFFDPTSSSDSVHLYINFGEYILCNNQDLYYDPP